MNAERGLSSRAPKSARDPFRTCAGDPSPSLRLRSGHASRLRMTELCVLHSAFVVLALAACSGTKQKPAEERIPVTVAVAQKKDIPLQIRAIGSVQPLATVAVRALVGGQLMNVWFREGDDVAR